MEINLTLTDNAMKVFTATNNSIWKNIIDFSSKNTGEAKENWLITGFVAKTDNFWISIRKTTKEKETTINMKVGKFLSYMNGYGITDLSPSQIEHGIAMLQSTIKGDNIQILNKDRILDVYHAKNYKYPHLTEDSQKKGILSTSCMRYTSCQEYIKFFGCINNVRIMALFDNKKVVARALLWETQQGVTIMDRVYYSENHQYESFISMAKANKWVYYVRKNDHDYLLMDNSNNPVEDHFTVTLEENSKPALFPYLDTFRYYDYRTHRLSNRPFVTKNNIQIVLNNTSGMAEISNQLNQDTLLTTKEYERLKMKGLLHGFHLFANNINFSSMDFKDIYKGKDVINKMDIFDITITNWGSVPQKRFIRLSSKLKDGTSFVDNLYSLKPNKIRYILMRMDIVSVNDYFLLLKLLDDNKNTELLSMVDFHELFENGQNLFDDVENTEILLSMVSTFTVARILEFYTKGFFPKKFFRELIKSNIHRPSFVLTLNHNIYLNSYSVFFDVYTTIPELAHNKGMAFIKQSKTFTLGKSFGLIIDDIRKTTGYIPVKTPFKYRKGFKEKIKWILDLFK